MKVPGASKSFSPFLCLVLLFGCCSSAWVGFAHAQAGDLLTPVAPVAPVPLAPPAAFFKITLPAQGKVLTAMPFVPFTQSVSGAVCCTSGLGNGPIKLMRWNAIGLGYETLDYGDSGWQRAPAENGSLFGLQPGDGFWLENKGSQPVDCMIMGRIPVGPYLTNTLLSGLTLFGLPYPTARALSDTPLAEEMAGNGDRIYTWSGTNYMILNGSNCLEVSQGYWYQRNGESMAWPVERPYGAMFDDGALPAVVALGCRPQGGILVTIRPQGGGGAVDILAQDLAKNQGFNADGSWQVVGKDLAVRDEDLEVADSQAGFGRAYLALKSEDRDQIYEQTADGVRLRPEWTRMEGDFGFELHYLDQVPDEGLLNGIANGLAEGGNDEVSIPVLVIKRNQIHVDGRVGRDTLSGYSQSIAGKEGPKKTIQAGLTAAEKGGTVVVHDGSYRGQTLNIVGRDVSVRIDGTVNLAGGSSSVPPAALPNPETLLGLETNALNR